MSTTYKPKMHRVTYKLTREAREQIKAAGLTIADYVRAWYGASETWRGDICGCPDDRCIDYHHDANQECGCLPACIHEFMNWYGEGRSFA